MSQVSQAEGLWLISRLDIYFYYFFQLPLVPGINIGFFWQGEKPGERGASASHTITKIIFKKWCLKFQDPEFNAESDLFFSFPFFFLFHNFFSFLFFLHAMVEKCYFYFMCVYA